MKIIAEIGFNHGGDMDDAVAMIRAAAAAGADIVKFQTFRATDILRPDSPYVEAIRPGELDLARHRLLKAEAEARGVGFLSTPFSPDGVDLLEEAGVDAYKVASMDVTNLPLLGRVAATGKPVYLSTGMAVLGEIDLALETLAAHGAGEVSLLHCLSQYPARAEDLHLSAIGLLRDAFGLPVGYSDHYPGIDACGAAFFPGGGFFYTHFPLEGGGVGGDHAHGADPAMLRRLCDGLALFEAMEGNAAAFFRRRPDRENARLFRRGLHAARDIRAGEVVAREDLLSCRPEGELSPADLDWVVGLRARRDVKALGPVSRNDFLDASATRP